MVAGRVAMGWLCGVLSVTALWSCDGSHESGAQGPAAHDPAADPTAVLAPGGSRIEHLTLFAQQKIALTVDEGQIRPVDRTRGFPLISYRRFCEDVPMSEFGLAEPRLRLVGRNDADERFTIDFGDANFTGAGIYARTEGSGCVYVVPSSAVALIAGAAGDQAAAAFQPPHQPDIPEEATADGPRKEADHPWVLQVKKHQAEAAGSDATADRKVD
jgi:hypothetical protein